MRCGENTQEEKEDFIAKDWIIPSWVGKEVQCEKQNRKLLSIQ